MGTLETYYSANSESIGTERKTGSIFQLIEGIIYFFLRIINSDIKAVKVVGFSRNEKMSQTIVNHR